MNPRTEWYGDWCIAWRLSKRPYDNSVRFLAWAKRDEITSDGPLDEPPDEVVLFNFGATAADAVAAVKAEIDGLTVH